MPELSLSAALSRVYQIRRQNRSYAVTMPPVLAEPFIKRFGTNVMYELVEEGVLMKPVPIEQGEGLPAWMQNGTEPETKKRGKR
jgi:hypothetical protein